MACRGMSGTGHCSDWLLQDRLPGTCLLFKKWIIYIIILDKLNPTSNIDIYIFFLFFFWLCILYIWALEGKGTFQS